MTVLDRIEAGLDTYHHSECPPDDLRLLVALARADAVMAEVDALPFRKVTLAVSKRFDKALADRSAALAALLAEVKG